MKWLPKVLHLVSGGAGFDFQFLWLQCLSSSCCLFLLKICASLGWKKISSMSLNSMTLTSAMVSKSPTGHSVIICAPGKRKGIQNRLGATHSCSTSHRKIHSYSWSASWKNQEWVMEHMGYWLLMETVKVFMIIIIHLGMSGKTNWRNAIKMSNIPRRMFCV